MKHGDTVVHHSCSALSAAADELSKRLQRAAHLDKVQATQTFLWAIHSELERASVLMRKQANEKDKLKAALADTLRKKDQLFNEARALYTQLSEVKAQHTVVLDKVATLEGSQLLLAAVKARLLHTDSSLSPDCPELAPAARTLVHLATEDYEVHELFQACVPSVPFANGQVSVESVRETLGQVLDFARAILVHFYTKRARVNAFEQMMSDSEKLMQVLPSQTSKIAQLNEQIALTIGKSKDTPLQTGRSHGLLDLKLDIAESKCSVGDLELSESLLLPSDRTEKTFGSTARVPYS